MDQPNKHTLDVSATRQHFYPKYIICKASPNGPRDLVHAVSLPQEGVDQLIDSGRAIPIPKNQQAVCDAMRQIVKDKRFEELEYIFLDLLEQHFQDYIGWAPFIVEAAEHFARKRSLLDEEMVGLLRHSSHVYYRNKLDYLESAATGHGHYFFYALEITKFKIDLLFDMQEGFLRLIEYYMSFSRE